jgi:hypothetical protein
MGVSIMTDTFNRHPQDVYSLIEEMHKGVEEAMTEDEVILHRIVDGKPHYVNGRNTFYTFTLQDDWEPSVDSIEVEIEPGNPDRRIPGTILSMLNRTITFVTETPLPQTAIKETALIERTNWLLKKLDEELLRLRGQGESKEQMPSKVFKLVVSREGRGQPQVHVQGFSPYPEQTKAISVGIKSECLYLIGPPGTGKTAVEACLALEYMLVNKRAFLLAPTNVALDNAMKRVKRYCEQSGNGHLVQGHRIVRLGKTKDLAEETYRDITLQGIVDQQMGPLAYERDSLQQEQSDLNDTITHIERNLPSRIKRWSREKKTLQARILRFKREQESLVQQEQHRLHPILARLSAIEKERQTILAEREKAKDEVDAYTRKLERKDELLKTRKATHLKKQHALSVFQTRDWWEQPGNRFNKERLTALTDEVMFASLDIDRTEGEIEDCKQNRATAVDQLTQKTEQLSILEREEQELLVQQQMHTPISERITELTALIEQDEQAIEQGDRAVQEAQEDLEQHRMRLVQIAMRLEDIGDEERALTANVIDHALLIGATLTAMTTNPYLRERKADAVIIDEASMSSMALILVAVEHATQHANIVGDQRQFSPVVKLKNRRAKPRAAYWLGTDIFSHLEIKLSDADTDDGQVVMLTQQARMVPEIADPISVNIYGGRLKNRLDSHRIPLRLEPLPQCPSLLVDTGDVDRGKGWKEPKICQTKRPEGSYSKYNDYHVECVVKLVRQLLAQLPESLEPLVGIVTPYNAQKKHLRDKLREHGYLHRVHVGTAHGFQSLECPVIIFDIVEAPPLKIGTFTSDVWGEEDIASNATRLINVAHSRARDKIIYVANLAYIQRSDYRQEHQLTIFVTDTAARGYIPSRDLQ